MAFPGASDQSISLASGELRVQAGFRVAESSGLAGGPIEVDFFVTVTEGGSLFLLVGGDRFRVRPANFSFAATFAGAPLTDPQAGVPDMGGPRMVLEIPRGRPWHQRLVLNEYVGLESTLQYLQPGASQDLVVQCQRRLPLAADARASFMPLPDAPLVMVRLTLPLGRDDARLVALVDQLAAEVRDGPKEQRERPLSIVLSLRAPLAVERWRVLVDHPDPAVAERVRQALRHVAR